MMSRHVADALGWVATVVFVGSCFFRRPAALRSIQMLGSALWIIYGLLIAAKQVIAANVLVFAAAAWTLLRENAVLGTGASGKLTPEIALAFCGDRARAEHPVPAVDKMLGR
jgi:hypothetical protein